LSRCRLAYDLAKLFCQRGYGVAGFRVCFVPEGVERSSHRTVDLGPFGMDGPQTGVRGLVDEVLHARGILVGERLDVVPGEGLDRGEHHAGTGNQRLSLRAVHVLGQLPGLLGVFGAGSDHVCQAIEGADTSGRPLRQVRGAPVEALDGRREEVVVPGPLGRHGDRLILETRLFAALGNKQLRRRRNLVLEVQIVEELECRDGLRLVDRDDVAIRRLEDTGSAIHPHEVHPELLAGVPGIHSVMLDIAGIETAVHRGFPIAVDG